MARHRSEYVLIDPELELGEDMNSEYVNILVDSYFDNLRHNCHRLVPLTENKTAFYFQPHADPSKRRLCFLLDPSNATISENDHPVFDIIKSIITFRQQEKLPVEDFRCINITRLLNHEGVTIHWTTFNYDVVFHPGGFQRLYDLVERRFFEKTTGKHEFNFTIAKELVTNPDLSDELYGIVRRLVLRHADSLKSACRMPFNYGPSSEYAAPNWIVLNNVRVDVDTSLRPVNQGDGWSCGDHASRNAAYFILKDRLPTPTKADLTPTEFSIQLRKNHQQLLYAKQTKAQQSILAIRKIDARIAELGGEIEPDPRTENKLHLAKVVALQNLKEKILSDEGSIPGIISSWRNDTTSYKSSDVSNDELINKRRHWFVDILAKMFIWGRPESYYNTSTENFISNLEVGGSMTSSHTYTDVAKKLGATGASADLSKAAAELTSPVDAIAPAVHQELQAGEVETSLTKDVASEEVSSTDVVATAVEEGFPRPAPASAVVEKPMSTPA